MAENNSTSILGKLPERIYEDLASPAMKKIGLAIGNIAELVLTATLAIEKVNKKARINFDKSIEKFQKKLEVIPEDQIIEAPSEISFPILTRFNYVSNEQLNNAFVNLLTSASNSETASLAHPGFISIIDRISPDEAKLLKFLKSEYFIPVITLKAFTNDHTKFFTFKKRTGLEVLVDVEFPDNMDVYLDNLESLGLIQMRHFFINQEDRYIYLMERYSEDRQSFSNELSIEFLDPDWEMKCYVITAFCRLFMDACID